MKIRDLFKTGKPVFSFEVFPPKRDGDFEGLFTAIDEVKALKPDFISVTYGAGGSTRKNTLEVALRLKALGILPLVHLTCVGHSKQDLAGLLDELKAAGVENVMALRGDPPKGETKFTPAPDGFHYANELVAFIRSRWDFCVGVAGYPETHPDAPSPEADLLALKTKVDAGGDFITTQLFFDNASYYHYVAKVRALGVRQPILPGIMPVLDAKSLAKFASFGAKVPDELRRGFEAAGEDVERARTFGVDFATRQCRDLLAQGAPGIHLCMMNRSYASLRIHEGLKGGKA